MGPSPFHVICDRFAHGVPKHAATLPPRCRQGVPDWLPGAQPVQPPTHAVRRRWAKGCVARFVWCAGAVSKPGGEDLGLVCAGCEVRPGVVPSCEVGGLTVVWHGEHEFGASGRMQRHSRVRFWISRSICLARCFVRMELGQGMVAWRVYG